MVLLLKGTVEVGEVAEAYGEGDIQDGGVAFLKEFHGFLQAEADDVLHAGHVHVLFEKTHEDISQAVLLREL